MKTETGALIGVKDTSIGDPRQRIPLQAELSSLHTYALAEAERTNDGVARFRLGRLANMWVRLGSVLGSNNPVLTHAQKNALLWATRGFIDANWQEIPEQGPLSLDKHHLDSLWAVIARIYIIACAYSPSAPEMARAILQAASLFAKCPPDNPIAAVWEDLQKACRAEVS